MNFKLKLLAALLLLFGATKLSAQNHTFGCYTDHLRALERQQNPNFDLQEQSRDQAIRNFLKHPKNQTTALAKNGNPIVIPVLVQIIHNNGPENISDQQVISQINALNAAFDGSNVQFCLASARNGNPIGTPNGTTSTTPGILRKQSAFTVHQPGTQDEFDMKSLVPNFDANRYLKVWVVDSIASFPGIVIGGYSRIPGPVSPILDGVVVRADNFGELTGCGAGCNLSVNNPDGDVMVHEVGHYLGLYHTFEGNCSGMNAATCDSEGDRVCDTPPVAAPNNGCPATMNSCNETPDLPDLLDNYMDYTNEACRASFSDGQVDRMLATINVYRSGLSTPQNHAYTGINCSVGLGAFFTATRYTACLNESITFRALPQSGATYRWNFDGTIVWGQNVSQSFTTAYNPLQVELTVFSGGDSASTTLPFYIEDCTPITDPNSTWFFGLEHGVDFSSGVPVFDNSARVNSSINTNEPSAVQGDANGNLLFFTDGRFVWDANHDLVNTNPNDTMSANPSAQRGALIVPDPANNNRYYIFYSPGDQFSPAPNARGFAYSRVNVTGGGVVSMLPGINTQVPLPPGGLFNTLPSGDLASGEAISAIEHCDGYWLFCTADSASKKFLLTYNVSSSGIAYVGATDIDLQAGSGSGGAVNICPSPDGNKIAVSSIRYYSGEQIGLRVFSFDKFSGALGSLIFEDNFEGVTSFPDRGYYGLSFSPNSSVLYGNGGYNQGTIHQYDLNATDPLASKFLVGVRYRAGTGQMQLGPDNKLYITGYSRKRLAVVHAPDEVGAACMFSDYGPSVPFTTTPSFLGALPNIIDATLPNAFDNTISVLNTGCNTFDFQPNLCGVSFTWNFGDPASGTNNSASGTSAAHTFSGPGSYTVTVTNSFGVSATTTVEVEPSVAPDISGLDCFETGTLTNYSTTTAASAYEWSVTGGTIAGLDDGSNVDVVWNSLPGSVTLTTTNGQSCTASSTLDVTDCDVSCPCTINPNFFISVNGCDMAFHSASHPASCNVFHRWIITHPNGQTTNLFGNSITFIAPTAGTYEVCHIAEIRGLFDQVICSETRCNRVEATCGPSDCVNPCDIKPVIKSDTKDGCTYTFKGGNNGTECPSQMYQWTVFNGFGSLVYTFNGENLIDYTFPSTGSFKVCLKIFVEDEDGNIRCERERCIKVETDCKRCKDECKIDPEIKEDTDDNCHFDFLGINEGVECPSQIYYWEIRNSFGVLVHTWVGTDILDYVFTSAGTFKICLTIFVRDENNKVICKERKCIEKTILGRLCVGRSQYVPVTGDQVTAAQTEVTVYPNPNKVGQEIYFNGLDWEVVQRIEVINNLGKVVQTIVPTSNHFLPDASLSAGIYFVRFQGSTGVHTTRLILK